VRSLRGPLKAAALTKTAPIFAALGDETRLRLIAFLSDGTPKSITQLTTGTDVTRQAVTKHLQVLADVGIVRDIWAGRERRWELELRRLEEARRSIELIAGQWDHALSKLKRAVEGR
jgi:DNA-binding transcriptional ArsR family regulator